MSRYVKGRDGKFRGSTGGAARVPTAAGRPVRFDPASGKESDAANARPLADTYQKFLEYQPTSDSKRIERDAARLAAQRGYAKANSALTDYDAKIAAETGTDPGFAAEYTARFTKSRLGGYRRVTEPLWDTLNARTQNDDEVRIHQPVFDGVHEATIRAYCGDHQPAPVSSADRRVPRHTPWGEPQAAEIVAPGIVKVDTGSHGGFHLSGQRNAEVHPVWRNADGFYEEDQEKTIVVLTNPQRFTRRQVAWAEWAAKAHYPEEFARVLADRYGWDAETARRAVAEKRRPND